MKELQEKYDDATLNNNQLQNLLRISESEKNGMITAHEYMNLTAFAKKIEIDLVNSKRENDILYGVLEKLIGEKIQQKVKKSLEGKEFFPLDFLS